MPRPLETPPRVEELGLAAADEALRVGAHREAAAHFGRVLRAGVLGPQRRAEVLQRCGHENYLIDHFEEAVGHTAEAAELHRAFGDRVALGRSLTALAGVQLCVGRHEAAEASAREAVQLLLDSEAGGGHGIAGAYATLAAITKDGGDLSGGLELAAGRSPSPSQLGRVTSSFTPRRRWARSSS